MITKMKEGKYEGTISIWEVDTEGKHLSEYPIITAGKKKLNAILNHSEEIKDFFNLKEEE